MLFNKNYAIATDKVKEELNRWNHGNAGSNISLKRDNLMPLNIDFKNPYSNDFWRYISVFPNNNLFDPRDDDNDYSYFENSLVRFIDLVNDKKTREREVLNFVKDEMAYFIMASILKEYDFGHHGRYIFKEFPLGISHKADFLIIGAGSGGYRLIFVEIENIYGRITDSNGDLGEVLRKGLNQIYDWKNWIESNYSSLKEVFNKYKGERDDLPRELIDYDSTRISFVVIGGRRSDFNDRTYKHKRRLEKDSIRLLHYDNLIDCSTKLINTGAY